MKARRRGGFDDLSGDSGFRIKWGKLPACQLRVKASWKLTQRANFCPLAISEKQGNCRNWKSIFSKKQVTPSRNLAKIKESHGKQPLPQTVALKLL